MDNDSGHPTGDLDGDWLSHTELAERRGISKASAARMVRRHKWQRRTDNLSSGTVRILVPHHALAADGPTGVRPGGNPAIEALRLAIDTLRDQQQRADARADKAGARVEDLAAKLADAQEVADRHYAEAAAARGRLEDMERDNAARRARGRWARLRDAWRGRG